MAMECMECSRSYWSIFIYIQKNTNSSAKRSSIFRTWVKMYSVASNTDEASWRTDFADEIELALHSKWRMQIALHVIERHWEEDLLTWIIVQNIKIKYEIYFNQIVTYIICLMIISMCNFICHVDWQLNAWGTNSLVRATNGQ